MTTSRVDIATLLIKHGAQVNLQDMVIRGEGVRGCVRVVSEVKYRYCMLRLCSESWLGRVRMVEGRVRMMVVNGGRD